MYIELVFILMSSFIPKCVTVAMTNRTWKWIPGII